MSYLYNSLPDSFEERLETRHLILRPYQQGDENDFMQLLSENMPMMVPAFSTRPVQVRTLEDARNMVQQLRADWDNRKVFEFGVWLKDQEKYIGDISLKNLDYKIPKAELGMYFAAWATNKTHAQQALEAIVAFAFNTLVLNKVYIRCTNANAFIGELAEACGFIKEGILRSDYKGADSEELLDLSYYGMTREDFELKQKQKKLTQAEVEA
ncbi:GNAT family N-acetyltransferase [Botryobacter ruber]|uniref:GNAT family N-acetyltransferase n=1 Tax=Botryobacter ruber TaxID=2171629 RepID=UPI000E0A031B|nr:GNAT family protein [Botryobacter ruber]